MTFTSPPLQQDDSCDVDDHHDPSMRSISLTKQAFFGGPIPCVSFTTINNDNDNDNNINESLVFGRGPYLVHVPLTSQSSTSKEKSLLVFDQPGQNVHGICWGRAGRSLSSSKSSSQSTPTTSTIPDHSLSLAVVYGGRQIAFVSYNNTSSFQVLPIVRKTGNDIQMSMAAPDWIWDALLVRNNNDDHDDESSVLSSSANSTSNNSSVISNSWTLYLGLAHNAVHVWNLRVVTTDSDDSSSVRIQPTKTLIYQGSRRSISYSLCFDRPRLQLQRESSSPSQRPTTTTNNLDVAVGTVTNEILLWSVPAHHSSQQLLSSSLLSMETISEAHILRGHKGVIHAVQFCPTSSTSNRLLASASDDRSIRLWQEQKKTTENDIANANASTSEWTCRWVGWGHSARCWNVTFVVPKETQQQSTTDSSSLVASCSEDGTIQLWSTATGQSVTTFHGPAGGSYWSVAHRKDHLVAGANDGTVHVYDMHRVPLAALQVKQESQYGLVDAALHGSFRTTVLVPDDRPPPASPPIPEAVADDDTVPRKKKKKPKSVQQTLVGVDFVHDQGKASLVRVATRDASIWELNLQTMDWEKEMSWWDEGLLADHGVEAAHGCCLASHDNFTSLFAIGTTRGKVCLKKGESRVVLDGAAYKTVQKLEWLNPYCLLVYHVQALRCWKFAGHWEVDTLESISSSAQVTTFLTLKKPVLSSAAFNPSASLLVVGNTRGNLNLFQVPSEPATNDVSPFFSMTVHRKEHINAIEWTSDSSFLSAGNDGHLRETRVVEGNKLVPFLSVPVRAFTAIDRIWLSPNGSIRLGGYNSNEYSVIVFQTSYELFRVETGGRGRSLAMSQVETASRTIVLSCVNAARKDGLNDLILDSQILPSPLENDTAVVPSTFGASMHTETLFDVDLFAFKTGVKCMVTASEDCTSRFSVWNQDGVIQQQVAFPAQESGVRAVCCQRLPEDDSCVFLAEGGSKLVLRFYLAHLDQSDKVSLRFLTEGSPNENATIDHRINDVKAISYKDGMESHQLVVAGDSNGNVFAYRVPLGVHEYRRISGERIFHNARPVLSLEILEMNDEICLVVIGNSAGEVVIVSIQLPYADTPESSISVIHSIRGHSVGTNCITSTLVPTSDPVKKIYRICSGGDDQSLCCFELSVREEGQTRTVLTDLHEVSNGHQVSISAIRGLSWLDHSHLVVSGYGQRVSVWQIDDTTKTFQLAAVADTEIGDVNSLSAIRENDGHFTIAIAGIGVQLFSVNTTGT